MNQRGKRDDCKCGYWHNFCDVANVSSYIDLQNGIPVDRGNCAVCLGLLYPGPKSLEEKWKGLKPQIDPHVLTAVNALIQACKSSNIESIKKNLNFTDSQGVIHNFVNIRDPQGKSPLIICCEKKHEDSIEFLLTVEDIDVNRVDNLARSPLQRAADIGYLFGVQRLLKVHSIKINQQDVYGNTALHYAIDRGHNDIINSLEKAGADIHVQALNGDTALTLAVSRGNNSLVTRMLSELNDEKRNRALWDAANARIQYPALVEQLLISGVEKDFIFDRTTGKTALIQAAKNDHKEVLKLLICKKWNINHQDSSGRTALMEAAKGFRFSALKELLDNGANANLQDSNGHTALMEAVCSTMPIALCLQTFSLSFFAVRLLYEATNTELTERIGGQRAIDLAKAKGRWLIYVWMYLRSVRAKLLLLLALICIIVIASSVFINRNKFKGDIVNATNSQNDL